MVKAVLLQASVYQLVTQDVFFLKSRRIMVFLISSALGVN